MEVSEIINLGAKGVKSNPQALNEYKRIFFTIFGKSPECPSCGSSVGVKDWDAFTAYSDGQDVEEIKKKYFNFNSIDMEKTFIAKPSNDLLTFFVLEDGRYFAKRSYINSMSEEFAILYLDSAKDEEELEERKRLFLQLPAKFRIPKEVKDAEEFLNAIDVNETLDLGITIDEQKTETTEDEEPETAMGAEDEQKTETTEDEEPETATESEEDKKAREERNAKRRERDKAKREAAKNAAETK